MKVSGKVTLRRIIAGILTLALVFTLMPAGSVFASDEITDENVQDLIYDEQIAADPDALATQDNGSQDYISDDLTSEDLLTEGPASEELISDAPVSDAHLTDEDMTEELLSEEAAPEGIITEDSEDGGTLSNDKFVHPGDDEFTVTFTGRNNGEEKILSYINNFTVSKKVTDFIKDYPIDINAINTLSNEDGAILDPAQGDDIRGWKVTVDGADCGYLFSNFTYFSDSSKEFVIYPRREYVFTAEVYTKLTDNIFIETIPKVYYDGRAHVVTTAKLKESEKKSKANDLIVDLYYWDEYGMKVLRDGIDYKVSYKNNTNASMDMDLNGNYTQKYEDMSKRPQVTITGIGGYAGFSAIAYFNILPYNLGKWYPHAEISGLKNAYLLKKGKVTGFSNPKITLTYDDRKAVNLKENSDYEAVIYEYKTGSWIMMKHYDKPGQPLTKATELTEEGRYLYSVRGKGNYCGIYGGQYIGTTIGTGGDLVLTGSLRPDVCTTYTESQAPWQFKLTADSERDLSTARVKIAKPTLVYDPGTKEYGAGEFGITVEANSGGNTWTPVPDSEYDIIFKCKDFEYIYGKTEDGRYVTKTYTGEFVNSVVAAGTYQVSIRAKSSGSYGFFGEQKLSKKVTLSGVDINNIALEKTTLQYNGAQSGKDDLKAVEKKASNVELKKPGEPISGLTFSSSLTDTAEFGKLYLCTMLNSDIRNIKNISPYAVVGAKKTINDMEPGSYNYNIVPVGPGVNRSKPVSLKYKREAIKTEDAISKVVWPGNGYYLLGVDVTSVTWSFNVAGSYPKGVKLRFKGKTVTLDMDYQGQSCTIIADDGDKITIRLWAYNNMKQGAGSYLLVEGDGKKLKGKSTTKAEIISMGAKYLGTQVPVINESNWYRSGGKVYPLTLGSDYAYVGDVYAVIKPGKKNNKVNIPTKPDITLYQSYYKNEADFIAGKKSLQKVDKKYYTLELINTDTSYTEFTVYVSAGKEKGYTFYSGGTSLSKPYTVYDGTVKIKSIDVQGAYVVDSKNTFDAPYTGKRICPTVTAVTLSDGSTLPSDQYNVFYGYNTMAGKKAGSIKIVTKHSSETTIYKDGSATFYFNITPADKKEL